jgi:O-antigen/teichoic acid export membrane protein
MSRLTRMNNDDFNNRTGNSARNLALGLINKMVIIVLSFVSRAIFIHILSVEYLGINSLFGDILNMLSLADLGFGTAMVYSFYKPLAEHDENKLSALITFYKKVYNIIALGVATIGLALIPFLELIINLEEPIPHLKVYYVICLSNSVISYLFAYKSSIIRADQKGYIVSKYDIWIKLLKTIVQILVLYLTHSYFIFLSLNVLSTLVNNLIISHVANKNYPYIKETVMLSKEEKNSIFTNLKSVFLYKIAGVIMSGTDNIIISILVSTVAVGLYSNYYAITMNQLGAVTAIVFNSLTASVGNLIVKEKPEKRYEVYKSMQMVGFMISGIFITCLYFLTDEFIILWIGEEFLLGYKSLIVILLNFYLVVTFYPIRSFREATGLYQQIKYVLIITAILNIAFSFILGSYFGIAGVIGATVVAKLATIFWYEPYVLFKDFFGKKTRRFFVEHIINLILIMVSIVIIRSIMPSFENITVINWLIKATIAGSIVCVIYGIRYYRTEEFHNVVKKVKYLVHH